MRDDPRGAFAGLVLAAVTLAGDHPFRQLVRSDGAFSAALNVTSTRTAGYATVSISSPPQFARSSLLQLREILERLGQNISAAQLASAKDRLFTSFLQSSSDASSLPQLLAERWGLSGSLDAYDGYEDALYAVDHQAMDDFADRYLRQRVHVGVLTASGANMASFALSNAVQELLP